MDNDKQIAVLKVADIQPMTNEKAKSIINKITLTVTDQRNFKKSHVLYLGEMEHEAIRIYLASQNIDINDSRHEFMGTPVIWVKKDSHIHFTKETNEK